MGKKFDFEYIVIGSGPAGITAALNLARLTDKKIAIVEGGLLGGALSAHDLPNATSLDFANIYYKATHSAECGISGMSLHFNFPTAVNHQNDLVRSAVHTAHEKLEKAGVTCILGMANFIDKNTIAIGEREYSARYFVIATGAKLNTSNIAGTENVNFLTPETAIKSSRLPKAVCVVGGGATGCEIVEYFAKLGVKTALLERSSRLLPREDEEVGKVMREYFENELGVIVLTNARVVALEKDNVSKRVVFSKDNHEKMVRVDTVVLATGSEPATDLGLENANVKYKRAGILVNSNFQTSAKNIFAIGDCIGGESSTDLAMAQGSYLALALAYRAKLPFNPAGIIRAVSTCPGVAVVGYSEDDLVRRDKRYRKELVYLSETSVMGSLSKAKGFVKIITNRENHLVGAVIVAPNAAAMAHELALAVRDKISAAELANLPHAVLSFSEAVQIAARRLMARKK
ncbi:MAG: NAD(P)/FAD-dependent oxidoreductase [Candidatus Saccharibacteria bacterium]|nr:NAD(P)/FAD-dependent oxidoreductase [Candidatus Saccharibacteria bacterium]